MKVTFSLPLRFAQNGAKRIAMGLVFAAAVTVPQWTLAAAPPPQAPVNLGSTAQFAILAGAAISSTGGGTINGNVGASPIAGSAIGVTQAQVNGIIYETSAGGPAGAVVDPSRLTTAKGDLTTAYNEARDRTPIPTGTFLNPGLIPGSGNIGGMSLAPGLYKFTSTALITGADVTLTGGPDDVWIFQITADLQVGSGIKVILAGGARAGNIFWQVGTSAVLGTTSDFKGTILASQSVTMNTTSTIEGRALAFTAGVTFNGVSISLPAMTVQGQDVSYATLSKVQDFWQTNAGAAVLAPPGLEANPFVFQAGVKQSPTGTVSSATVQLPGTTNTIVLAATSPASPYSDFLHGTNFVSKAAMDTAFTNGIYTFMINAAHDGTNALPVTMGTNDYPGSAPHIANWAAAQTINTASNFVLSWDALAGGTTNDFVSVAVKKWVSGAPGSNYVFNTAAWGYPGALNGTNTSVVIPAGTLTTNQTYYVEVGWSKFGALNTTNYPGAVGGSEFGKVTKFFINNPSPAQMLSPTAGATLTNATTTFSWDSGTGVTQYALWVGSAAATYDISALNVGTNLTQQLTLPVNGQPLYVRLWSWINGAWLYNDYTYTAYTAVKSRLTGLSNGATLGSSWVTFAWGSGTGVTQYRLWVGSSAGGQDIYGSVESGLSQTVNLPTDGRRVYMTLGSLVNGTWQNNTYEFTAYTASTLRAQMQSPAPGGTLTNTTVSFSWDSGTGVTQYALWVGRTPSSYELVAQAAGTNQTYATSVMPNDGSPVYVTLWSLINGVWENHAYNYTALLGGGASVKARMSSPANEATLTGTATTFGWNAGTGASQYALWAGSNTNSYDLYAANVGTNLSQQMSLPATGVAIYVRLWSWVSGAWQYNDYSYTGAASAKAQMQSPTGGTTLTNATTTFSWNSGTGVTQYALWVGPRPSSYDLMAQALGTNQSYTVSEMSTDGSPVYVTLWSWINGAWQNNSYRYKALTAGGSVKASMTTPANGATLTNISTTFGWDTGVGVSQYALWVGSNTNSYDLFASNVGSNLTQVVSLPATGGAIYVRLFSWVNGGWQWSDYSYTAPVAVNAQMQSLANGTTLSSSSATFSWDSGTGVSQYALWVGIAPLSYDLLAQAVGTNRSYTVTELPVDGGPIYVTLWSLINGVWQNNAYFYQTFLGGK